MFRIPTAGIHARRWAAPSAGFIAGYGVYHSQTREETFGQQVPLNMVRAYSTVAPLFRFIRGASEISPEAKEVLRCTRIMKSAENLGISSDALRKHILRMEKHVGSEEGSVERLVSLVNNVERWNPEILLLACEAILELPENQEVRTLHRALVSTSKKLHQEASNAETWTKKIYGNDAPLPANRIYTEKEAVDKLLVLIARKQHPIVHGGLGAIFPIDSIRWEYILTASAVGLIILLGQDGLGVGQYRCYDVVTMAQSGSHNLRELSDRGITSLKERLPPLPHLPESLPRFPHIRVPLEVAIVDYNTISETCKTHIQNASQIVRVYTQQTLSKADNLVELVRSKLGNSPLPPTPPQLPIETH